MQTTPRILWRALCGVVLVSAMVLSGCQSADRVSSPPASTAPVATSAVPVSSAAPTPTPAATPTLSRLVVTAKPTTPEETAALVAEAEQVYREMRRLMDEYEAQGGAATLPAPLKEYVGGKYAETLAMSLSGLKERGHHNTGPTVIKRVDVFTDTWRQSSLIGVEFCDLLNQRTYFDENGKKFAGEARVSNRAEFTRSMDGKLRMTDNDSKVVPECNA